MNIKWLSKYSQEFLERGYLLPDQTVENRIQVIGDSAEKILGIEGYSLKLQEYIANGWISLSTPIWANFGTNRGLPISCFGSYVEDSVEGILSTAAEIGTMSKYGGGTAGYFGEVRSRGSIIKDNGSSSGSKSFLPLFQEVSNTINQGCYDDKTEILTDKGWLLFKDIIANKSIKVAQVLENENIEFVSPLNYFEYDVNEELVLFKDSKNIDLLVTKNHNMVYKQQSKLIIDGKYVRQVKDKFYTSTAENCPLHRDIKYLHSAFTFKGYGLTPMERLLIAFQADGCQLPNCKNTIKFRFSKYRKVERLKNILHDLNLSYNESYYNSDNTHNITIKLDTELSKDFSWVTISDKSLQWCTEFINEVLNWDGSFTTSTNGNYSSTNEKNVDVLQQVCAISGFKSSKNVNLREKEVNKVPIFNLFISKGNYFGVEKLKKQYQHYQGKVYCVEVPTNKLIIRRNGKTVVCGNSTRRGYFSAYLPIDHGDIEEWLNIRTEGDPIQQITYGICVPSWWIKSMREGDKYKQTIWAKLIQRRFETGLPYIFFTDNANYHESTPEIYKGKILHSQMCTEIMEPNSKDESFTCDLASLNDLYFEEYSKTDCVKVVTYLLDAANTEFIEKASNIKFFEKAVRFAKNHRALGIGRLGYNSLLQSKMIPFESLDARYLNLDIQRHIQEQFLEASKELKELFGPPEGYPNLDRRNTVGIAIAPTKSSAFIMGVSESIEVRNSNYFIQDLAKGKFVFKNPYLEKLLDSYGQNTEEVWESIKLNHGSILHLDFLSNTEKLVFKTAKEINQEEVIIQAAQRQKFIDQGQSLNLFISPDKTAKDVNKLILLAHDLGIKSLYYQHNTSAVQNLTKELTCVSCE